MQLSAVIITYNEERNIGRCLDALEGIADEIVVVDSYSTDGTEALCRLRNIRFLQHPFEGHIQQKNYAIRQAQFEYVLSLDADEVLSDSLKQSILHIKRQSSLTDAYQMSRMTNFCGKWIRYGGWYPDRKIRLWNKNKGKWGGLNPHDKVILQEDANYKRLKGDILHYSFNTVNEHVQQIHYFTDISSLAAFEKGKRTSVFSILIKPAFKFFRDYILKAGFMDGYYGLVIAINSAYAKFLKYLKLYERQKGRFE